MGRRQGESVVARFTSFGCSSFTKTISRKSSNGGGVELQRRHGSSVVQHLSINDTEHFPPLAASVLTKRAPLFGPPIPPELVRVKSSVPTGPRASDDDVAYAQDRKHGTITEAQRLEAQLAAAQAQVPPLPQTRSGHQGKGTESNGTEASQQASVDHQAAFDALATQYFELKALVESRLREVNSAASHLLASFQSQGYEVASGLDLLQDDLAELEAVHAGSEEDSLDEKELTQGGALVTPVRQPVSAPAAASTPPPASPGTEKMVVLKARREHVEVAFLELVRSMVGGLERLVSLTAQKTAPSTNSTDGGADRVS